MSTSLKGLTPALARFLGSTPAALYERQRALVRAGLLPLESGRGPGSGVLATAHAVALLVIAVLATDSLSETDERLEPLCQAAPQDGEPCPITHMRWFIDALAAILIQPHKAREVTRITVSRTAGIARIQYTGGVTLFNAKAPPRAGIQVEASIDCDLIVAIAGDVHELVLASDNWERVV
jgi:hypothetical protein